MVKKWPRNIFLCLLSSLLLGIGCVSKKDPEVVNTPTPISSSTLTSITATGPVIANGVSTSIVTIVLADSRDVALVGVVPTFDATNTHSKNIYGACTPTNTSGVSTCNFRSTRAETKTLRITSPEVIIGPTIVFIPDVKSKLAFSTQPSTAVLVNNNLSQNPVAQVQDAFDNPIIDSIESISLSAFTDSSCSNSAPGTLVLDANPLATDGATGIVTFSGVKYSKWETLYLKATASGLESACSSAIAVTQILSTGLSSISATDTIADGSSTSSVSISLKDTGNNPVFGATPTFLATDSNASNLYGPCSSSDASGNSTCTMTSTKAEVKTFSITSPTSLSDGNATFSPGPVSTITSSISGTQAIANNSDLSAITITLLDLFSNPIVGQIPTFSATDTGATNSYSVCSATSASGISTCSMTSTKAESKTIQIDTPISKTGTPIAFINGPVSTLTFSTQPSATAVSNLNFSTQPILEARDAFSNLITASSIAIALTPYTNVSCTAVSAGTLSATNNPVSTSNGVSSFSGVKHSVAEGLYIKASTSGIEVCSNLVTVSARPEIAYSASTINENVSNTGSITETLTLTLSNDTFTGTNGDDFIALSKIAVNNLPAGLSAVATKSSPTVVTLSLTGTATSHANSNDLSNLSLTFADSAISTGVAANMLNYNKSDININFLDPYTLSFSQSSFNEDVSNIGSSDDTSVVTLVGTTFTGSDTDDFVALSKINVANVPAGMAVTATRNSATQITIALTGQATNHSNAEDISNLSLTFLDSAFTSGSAAGVTDSTKSDFSINFLDPASLSYNLSELTEDVSNIGAISNSIIITLSNDTFETDLTGDITFTNTPAGLTASAVRTSSTQVTVSLTGQASSHDNIDDVANFTVDFLATAFVNNTVAANVINSSKNDILINFIDPASLAYSATTINERIGNDGGINETIIITLTGDTFAADISGDISSSNVPSGLVANFSRLNDTQVLVTFTGQATLHASANDVSNFTITFSNAAFVNNALASNVINYAKNDNIIDFLDPPSLSYSSSTFIEDVANVGSISNALTVTLSGDTFSSDLTGQVSISNVPTGLIASIVRDSDSQIRILLTANAVSHSDADDITNLTVTFSNGAFTNSASASFVTNYNKSDIVVDFIDPATLSYSATTLNEVSGNNGAFTETLIITLTGDTFEADLTGDISATNLPTGLSAVFTRDSDTQVTFSLTGNASSHANTDDIGNLGVTFSANAFANNTVAANVTGYLKNNLVLNFSDPAILSYSASSAAESTSNNGSITDTLIITLTGDTFAADLTGDISASNLPTGLSAVFTRDSSTQVTLSFTGNATNHTNGDDIANLTVTFANAAFVNTTIASNVTNYLKNNIALDFIDPAAISYSAASLAEVVANTGAISDTIAITLSGDTFASDLTGDITASNTPAGLSAVFTRNSGTQVTLSFTGTATNHADANDIANLTITFSDAAFVNNSSAANVSNYLKNDIAVDFIDPATLTYSASSLSEVSANTGAIAGSLIITLSGDTFPADLTGDIVATNVPAGLSAVFTRDSSTQVTLSFSAQATNHENANDIANLSVTFSASAFVNNTNAANVTNYLKNDIVIDFTDAASLAFSTSTISESIGNNGSTSDTIIITLTGDTFEADLTGDMIASNVPAGLTSVFTRDSATQMTLSFTGNATNHANSNDIGNLTITFQDSAFVSNTSASNVTNYLKNDITVDFLDPASLSYSASTLAEVNANNGAVSETIIITLSGDTFDADLTGDISASNVPAGLSAVLTRDSATQVTFSLSGNASAHANVDDVSDLTITFSSAAFVNNTSAANVTNYLKNDLIINFSNPASLTYSSSTLNETVANTGLITETLVITLSGDTFSSDLTGDIAATNVPAGLTSVFTRDSATQVTLSLTGNATNHDDSDDIANLTITFADAAFTNNSSAANVTNYLKNDISINYNAPASLSYSTSNLSEVSANTGAITSTIVITLSGDTFPADLTGDIVATNVPTGLSAVFTRNSGTQITLSFSGSATNHENANDISNLTVTFSAAAFTNNTVAANVTNYAKNDIVIDFSDAATLSYSGLTLNEVAGNDGTITDTITITLSGDTFEADLTGDVTATNVPTGLSAVFTRDSSTQVTLSLSGNAIAHANANDIGNLSVTFLDTAFVNNSSATNVTNYLKNDITINFSDPATLSYSAASFAETAANTGAITDTIVITLSGDTFAADLTGDISATNVPVGLSAVFTRDSDTQVTLSFTGNATSHANGDDITNLTVTFANAAFTTNSNATNVTNYNRSDIAIDFIAPASLSYASATVNESSANTGEITDTLTITLSGDTFAADLTGDIIATNVPTGLTVVFTRDSATQVSASFTGNATNHANADDISNLTFTFSDTAFVNNTSAANVINYSRNDIAVNFTDPAGLSYNAALLTETSANTGVVADTLIITLTGDTFVSDLTGKISASNVPAGLAAVFTRDSSGQITFSLTGQATLHENSNDVANLTITFTADAFTNNTDATNVTNYLKNNITIDFADAAALNYSASTLTEDLSNTGSITSTLTITLTGDSFAADLTGDILITNTPTGLTAVITRDSGTQLTLSFTGNASSHTNSDDVGNVTLTFSANAFANNTDATKVTNYLKNDITLDFSDPATLSYNVSNLSEASANNGSITDTLIVTLTGDTFAADLTGDISATNVPAGLSAVFTRDSATQITLSFTGSATNHANSNDISNLTVTFSDAAFVNNSSASNITNYIKNNISVDFRDTISLAYSTSSFLEGQTRVYDGNTVVNYRFNDTAGTVHGTDASINAENLSAFGSGIAQTSSTLSKFGILSFFLNDDYLASSSSALFNFAGDFTIEGFIYVNSGHLATAPTHGLFILNAAVNNRFQIIAKTDGRVGLEDDSGEVLSASSGVIAEQTWHHVALAVNGAGADSWKVYVDGNEEVSTDLGSNWNTTAHTLLLGVDLGDSSNRINAYYDEVRLSDVARYTTNFVAPSSEFGSDQYIGQIGNTSTITLTNDTFTGSINDDFVNDSKVSVSNLPSGLTAVVTRLSSTQVRLSLTGTADAHTNGDDISNLTITFEDTAFTNATSASEVVNYNKNNLVIDYQ